jgi:hypothetical protein
VAVLCRLLANLYNGNVYLWNYNDSVSITWYKPHPISMLSRGHNSLPVPVEARALWPAARFLQWFIVVHTAASAQPYNPVIACFAVC